VCGHRHLYQGRGVAERVSFSNITIGTLEDLSSVAEYLQDKIYPIFVDIEKRFDDSPLGGVRDLTFSDIHIRSDNGILIQGMRESPVENLSLRNITLRVPRGYSYEGRMKHHGGVTNPNDDRQTRYAQEPSYVTLAHVDTLSVDGLRVLVEERAYREYGRRALSVHETARANIRSVSRLPAGPGGDPILYLENCQQVLVSSCIALPGAGTFLGVSGMNSADISLAGNDLHAAHEKIRLDGGAAGEAVRSAPHE